MRLILLWVLIVQAAHLGNLHPRGEPMVAKVGATNGIQRANLKSELSALQKLESSQLSGLKSLGAKLGGSKPLEAVRPESPAIQVQKPAAAAAPAAVAAAPVAAAPVAAAPVAAVAAPAAAAANHPVQNANPALEAKVTPQLQPKTVQEIQLPKTVQTLQEIKTIQPVQEAKAVPEPNTVQAVPEQKTVQTVQTVQTIQTPQTPQTAPVVQTAQTAPTGQEPDTLQQTQQGNTLQKTNTVSDIADGDTPTKTDASAAETFSSGMGKKRLGAIAGGAIAAGGAQNLNMNQQANAAALATVAAPAVTAPTGAGAITAAPVAPPATAATNTPAADTSDLGYFHNEKNAKLNLFIQEGNVVVGAVGVIQGIVGLISGVRTTKLETVTSYFTYSGSIVSSLLSATDVTVTSMVYVSNSDEIPITTTTASASNGVPTAVTVTSIKYVTN